VAFQEALSPEFKSYQEQVIKNADALAKSLIQRGLRIVSGRTESHVMLVDLRAKKMTGKEAEAVLGLAHITCNKNGIPNDPEKPFVTYDVWSWKWGGIASPAAELPLIIVVERADFDVAFPSCGKRTW
jgi:glycine/serine hydroxymethyltransferase